jgi:hypothetical protein
MTEQKNDAITMRSGFVEDFGGKVELIDDNPVNPVYRITLPPDSSEHRSVEAKPPTSGTR